MSTLTLTTPELRNLLAPVVPLASTDSMFPVLNGVLIESAGKYVTARATDRFRAGIQRIHPKAGKPDEFRALVPLADAKRLLTIYKAVRGENPDRSVTLEIADDVLWVESTGGLGFDLGTMRLGFKTIMGDFPKVGTLFSTALGEVTEPSEAHLDHRLLVGFKEAAAYNGDRSAITMLRGVNPRKALTISIGEDFIGLIMPRLDGGAIRESLLDSWGPVLA